MSGKTPQIQKKHLPLHVKKYIDDCYFSLYINIDAHCSRPEA